MDFSTEMQRKVVALLLRSTRHASLIAAILDPQWIEDDMLADVAEVAVEYVKTYKAPPTKAVLKHECGADVVRSRSVDKAFRVSLRDSEWVVDNFAKWCRLQAVERAIISAAEEIRSGKAVGDVDERLANIVPAIRKAIETGTSLDAETVSLRDFDTRLKWILNRASVHGAMPTGLAPFDNLTGGGLGLGEFGVVIGASGFGKSFSLTNFGAYAISQLASDARDGVGTKVVHYTLELSGPKTWKRYDKLLAGRRALEKFEDHPHDFMTDLRRNVRLATHRDSDLIVRRFPNKTLTPDMLRADLDRVAGDHGFDPDLILVDYMDEMKPPNEKVDKRFQLGDLASELRAIAIERNTRVWTATQASKSALSKEVVTEADIAESYFPVRVADVVLTICRTPEEEEEHRMRYFAAKVRDSESRYTIDCQYDFARGTIRAVGLREQVDVTSGGRKKDDKFERMVADELNGEMKKGSRNGR